MRISKANIESWQESLARGMVSKSLLSCLADVLCDLEDFAKRELDEQHVWHCTTCNKTYVRRDNRCTCKHGGKEGIV